MCGVALGAANGDLRSMARRNCKRDGGARYYYYCYYRPCSASLSSSLSICGGFFSVSSALVTILVD